MQSIAVYVSGGTKWQPYVGFRSGLLKLSNVRGYDVAGMSYSLDAETFEFGGTLGLAYKVKEQSYVFLEGSYGDRKFHSLDWKLPAGMLADSTLWSRDLDLSAFFLALGYQFKFKE